MDEIIKHLAKKYNLSLSAIRAITESPSRFIYDELKKDEFKNYNLEGLGKFIIKARYRTNAKEEHLKIENKRIKRREDRRNSRGVDKPSLGQSGSGSNSQEEA